MGLHLLIVLVCLRVTFIYIYMGVSKNKGTPKWMVNIMVPNPYFLMDDLGVLPPLFLVQHPYIYIYI